jgi:acyl carrier protein
MDNTRERLAGCFRIVFPGIPPENVYTLSQSDFPQWDSVAAITLVNVIEEEFGIELDFEVLAELTSFSLILDHVVARGVQFEHK